MFIQLRRVASDTSRRLSFVMRLSALGLERALFQKGDRDHIPRTFATNGLSAGRAIPLVAVVVLFRSH